MKKIFIFIFLLFPLAASANELVDTTVAGHKVKAIKVIKSTGYKLIVGVSKPGESLDSIVKRYGGVSGVNGAYFCPADYKTQCPSGNMSYADRISNGFDWSYSKDDTGPDRVVFALDKNQNPFLYQKAHDYSRGRNDEFLIGKTINFERKNDIYNGIGNHPLLLENGVSKILDSKALDNKMKAKSLKNFICSSKDGNTIIMGGIEDATLYEVPELLLRLGCYNAINLDSGGSSAMIYNNKYVRGPGRNIMDAWIVIPDKNYPIKSVVSEDPKITSYRSSIISRFRGLDDLSRKQKLLELNSKIFSIISRMKESDPKRSELVLFKKAIDSLLQ